MSYNKEAIANEVTAPLPDGRATLAASITTLRRPSRRHAPGRAIERAQAMLDAADAELERAAPKSPTPTKPIPKEPRRVSATKCMFRRRVLARKLVHCRGERREVPQLRLALDRLRADLVELEDDAIEAANDVAVSVKALVLPVAETIYKQLLDHKRRVAVLGRILSELVADDGAWQHGFILLSMKAASRVKR